MNVSTFQRRPDVLELLRLANPHPHLDDPEPRHAIGEACRRIVNRATHERGRILPRRRGLIAIVVTFSSLVILAAPALALRGDIILFFSSPEPPQEVKTVVYALAEGAPAGMDPGLIPSEARIVASMQVNHVARQLWVAPTSAGGLCYGWVGLGGGCDKFGTIPLNVSWSRTSDGTAISHVDGFIHTRYAEGLELHFANGKTLRPPLTRVTSPINAAFFSVDLPAEDQDGEQTLAEVRAVDTRGEVIAAQAAPLNGLGRPDPLRDAVMSTKRLELTTATAAGQASIYSAATRYGGRCVWLELAGKRYYLAPCEAARYPFDPFSIQPIVADDAVVLAGTIGDPIDRLLVRFADGDAVEVEPNRLGFLLYNIPARHLQPGHEAEVIAGLRPNGSEETFYRLPQSGDCYSALPKPTTPADCPNAPLP